MQQYNEIKSNVHIKVEYNQEYRRFVVETLSFEHLEKTLRTLLNIDPTQPIKILFLDDEKDWVLITTDAELTYAAELSASLLRLSVKSVAAPSSTVSVVGVPFALPGNHPMCHRGMRGKRGRGCRGGGMGRCDPAMRAQFLDNKLARLTERHAMLKEKLVGMPEDQERALSYRLSHLENKIENVKWKKEKFAQHLAEQPLSEATEVKEETETAAPATEPVVCWEGRGRGCRGGRGRGGHKWMCEGADTHPGFEALLTSKAELKAARQGGNKEEIQAKWEALQKAKTNWRETKQALMAARRQAK